MVACTSYTVDSTKLWTDLRLSNTAVFCYLFLKVKLPVLAYPIFWLFILLLINPVLYASFSLCQFFDNLINESYRVNSLIKSCPG